MITTLTWFSILTRGQQFLAKSKRMQLLRDVAGNWGINHRNAGEEDHFPSMLLGS